MAHYHNVNTDSLTTYLSYAGFTRGQAGNEVMFFKRSQRNPNVVVKVYTSARVNAPNVRRKGADAIRVCVVYENEASGRSFGIGKFPKVLRTTSDDAVVERVRERLDMAINRAIEWMDQNPNA